MYQTQAVIQHTLGKKNPGLAECRWPEDGLHYIPDWVYTSQAVHDLELQKIFRGRSWNYVALEAEIPNAGDFKRSYVGATPVVVSRAEDGSINVFENRCAHRGAEFCRHSQGNTKEFVCPYHQWSYDLKGNLQGVPFKRGVNRAGGMPKDFRNEDHGLVKLHVATRNGVIFASYAPDMESLEDYMTPEILKDFDVVFNGKPLKVLGYYKNELPCNWKMYHENLKDPYHATLLHSFLVVFGLLVAGNESAMIADPVHGRHGTMASAKKEDKYAAVSDENKKEMRSYHEGMQLEDERFLEYVREFDSPWSVTMQTIWPNLIVQREMNTLGVRQIVPNGPDSMLMLWTMFGYEDDTGEMTQHRLRQGNLMGPAGFLGLEDNEAMKFVQEGVRRSSSDLNVLKLDAQQIGTSSSLISESAIRAMYQYYRGVMGF
ncbi:aromatic ring-hydroxylating dioxygenase subunit alpha [Cupriavidus taiwanensis]|uniref:Salicylate 5-hydroxylase, large oxygenase component n=1 Tax=Cupriavidus taiwanensis TaxID=164546 RepID=A0A375I518_9BURK|nr:aromatic ring-hydroxylating dioxygenase subunit alpha [Cupriavidus taiwanensis]SOY72658.1 Salicylate 5-hydroxylase, large oxygenase component [Cupriavidus taiwanensis]SOY72851.1 Salicylate 5-hydroxylase, large oxygenase component [Cupriavidus taiwanensis]SOY96785.1 Salicylate 5-hydroxylase, large oxygenase component [Cupriavidus taiwanensis]SOZ30774.1 Salicylate 5-hydroxylase, large oxygenase component [Cupriavidus taiwanensis]SOZ66701.1 Salicylate 5-hydroxylase, large oxygenase component [